MWRSAGETPCTSRRWPATHGPVVTMVSSQLTTTKANEWLAATNCSNQGAGLSSPVQEKVRKKGKVEAAVSSLSLPMWILKDDRLEGIAASWLMILHIWKKAKGRLVMLAVTLTISPQFSVIFVVGKWHKYLMFSALSIYSFSLAYVLINELFGLFLFPSLFVVYKSQK